MSPEALETLEAEHVHKFYSEVANHFSETRHKAWPEVAAFINSLAPGSLLADIGKWRPQPAPRKVFYLLTTGTLIFCLGCGNGKNLHVNPPVIKIGLDNCVELVQIASHHGCEVVTADCMSLPLRSNCFDAVICIAVIHHLSTEDRRVKALKELVRVLSVGGKLLVYVWAFEQKREVCLYSHITLTVTLELLKCTTPKGTRTAQWSNI